MKELIIIIIYDNNIFLFVKIIIIIIIIIGGNRCGSTGPGDIFRDLKCFQVISRDQSLKQTVPVGTAATVSWKRGRLPRRFLPGSLLLDGHAPVSSHVCFALSLALLLF